MIREYFEHARHNMTVCFKCVILALFHFVHAIIPVKYTSHEYWEIGQ